MGTFGFDIVVIALFLIFILCWVVSEWRGTVHARILFGILIIATVFAWTSNEEQLVLKRRAAENRVILMRIAELLDKGEVERVKKALQPLNDGSDLGIRSGIDNQIRQIIRSLAGDS